MRWVLRLGVLLLCGGCSAPVVAPPDSGRCNQLDTMVEARRAVAALTVVTYAPKTMYEVAVAGKPARFEPRKVSGPTRAVITYPDPQRFSGGPDGFQVLKNRSYVYDNALYALWLISEGKSDESASVLRAMVALQRSDGAWGFSFDARGGQFYNAAYVRTGVVSWVVLALAQHTLAFKDPALKVALQRGVAWLQRRRDAKSGLLQGGLGRWVDDGQRFEADYVASWASTEHNVDAYFALRAAEKAGVTNTGHAALGEAISKHLYIAKERRYAQGLQGTRQDTVSALDAAGSWTALFELAVGRPQRASDMLRWLKRHHTIDDGGWAGYKPYRQGPDVWFVEGSLAIALARHRLGRLNPAKQLTAEAAALSCVAGRPLLYSTSWAKDFPATPAAAPTLWFALVAKEVDAGGEPFLWPISQ